MAVNKVIYGGKTLIDLTDLTVTPETLAEGVTAINAQGEKIVGASTQWVNLTLSSSFANYNGLAENAPKYKVNGNLVTIQGCVSPKTAFTSSAEGVAITASLPAAYRPTNDVVIVCSGSGMNRWVLRIRSDGILYHERYGGTSYATVPTNAWCPFCVTYSI